MSLRRGRNLILLAIAAFAFALPMSAQSSVLTPAEKQLLAQELAQGQAKRITDFANARLGYTPVTNKTTDRIIMECLAIGASSLERSDRWKYLAPGLQSLIPPSQNSSKNSPATAAVAAAVNWFRQVTVDFPNSPYADFFLGQVYRFLPIENAGFTYEQKYSLAIQAFQAATDNSPRFSEAYFWLGDSTFVARLVLTGRLTEEQDVRYKTQSEDAYKKTIQLDPSNAEALHRLGNLSEQDRNYEEAINYLKKALALRPSDVTLHMDLGRASLEGGQLDDAISETLTATSSLKNPSLFPALFCTLGEAYEKKSDFKKAVDAYEECVKFGSSLYYRDQVKEKISLLQRELSPK